MPTVNDIRDYIYSLAPEEYAMPDDNTGLLLGRSQARVERALIALDVTGDVIREARETDARLIISHHPVFFSLNCANDSSFEGGILLELAEHGVAAICMHTNIDAAPGWLNDVLAQKLGLCGPLEGESTDGGGRPCGLMRIGNLNKPAPLPDFAGHVKNALGTKGLRYLDSGKNAGRVAVSSGAGGSMFDRAVAAGCDTFVTGDVKYHLFVKARELGINLIDAGHFATETIICETIAEALKKNFPELEINVSRSHRDFTEIL